MRRIRLEGLSSVAVNLDSSISTSPFYSENPISGISKLDSDVVSPSQVLHGSNQSARLDLLAAASIFCLSSSASSCALRRLTSASGISFRGLRRSVLRWLVAAGALGDALLAIRALHARILIRGRIIGRQQLARVCWAANAWFCRSVARRHASVLMMLLVSLPGGLELL